MTYAIDNDRHWQISTTGETCESPSCFGDNLLSFRYIVRAVHKTHIHTKPNCLGQLLVQTWHLNYKTLHILCLSLTQQRLGWHMGTLTVISTHSHHLCNTYHKWKAQDSSDKTLFCQKVICFGLFSEKWLGETKFKELFRWPYSCLKCRNLPTRIGICPSGDRINKLCTDLFWYVV